jgi:RNA polymerase sigma-70 factor (ECF subfamily)
MAERIASLFIGPVYDILPLDETFRSFVDSVYVDGPTTPAGFSDLYQRHSRDVYRFALYLSGDPNLADDITAESFLRVWQSAAPVRLGSVKAYLLAIARNLFLHELRRLQRLTGLEERIPSAVSLEKQTGVRAELDRVLTDLRELPEADRAAVLLRAEDGLSYEEIADVLGLPVSTVKVKVHRARLKLVEKRGRSVVTP